MPITAILSRTLHDALGDEAAADLVNWMEQVDTHRAELRDLNELNAARIDSRFEAADARIDARFQAADARLNEVRHELRAEIGALRMEMHDGFADVGVALAGVESKIDRRFAELLKWSFVFWCGAVAAAVLAGRLR